MKKEIEDRLIAKNIRPTSMRIVVYDFLSKQETALSLSEIEYNFDHADRVTLYRTLKTFEEKGVVHSIHENNSSKYKLCNDECGENTHNDRHLHFYCKTCKQTTCKEYIEFPVNLYSNFSIDEIHFFAKGICENCTKEI